MLTGEIDSSEEKEYSSSVYDGFSQYASSSVASSFSVSATYASSLT